jgi:hypothetical protein
MSQFQRFQQETSEKGVKTHDEYSQPEIYLRCAPCKRAKKGCDATEVGFPVCTFDSLFSILHFQLATLKSQFSSMDSMLKVYADQR